MSDELDGIDFGQDFADLAPGRRPVTIESVDPDAPTTVRFTAEDVPAARLVTKPGTAPARGGEVGFSGTEFWFRTDLLGFEPKARGRITEADGTVWIVDAAELTGGGGPSALAKCPVTRSRS